MNTSLAGGFPAREADTEKTRENREGNTPVADNAAILAGLAEIVEEVAGVAQDDVTAEKSFVDDLDIDSLSMVEIAVQAEDKFGVKIPDDELANLKTVGDAVNYVSANSK
jgi:acyl carrier protein